LFRRRLEQIVFKLSELTFLNVNPRPLSKVAAILQFAAHSFLDRAADIEGLCDVASVEYPMVGFCEQPPEHPYRIEGQALIIGASLAITV
jgi:hypothetical protein